jgi:hypothetical protein
MALAVIATVANTAVLGSPVCRIEEGLGIAGVQIGMSETAALAASGGAAARRQVGSQVIYVVGPPLHHVTTRTGVVQRVSTRSPTCRTHAGIGPGVRATAVRAAYEAAPASTLTVVPEGEWLSYPFNGIAFLMRGPLADTVEVFTADRIGAGPTRPAGPLLSPRHPAAQDTPGLAPTPAQKWTITSLAARVDGPMLVVTGELDNPGRAQAVYAEVTAFDPNGRAVGSGDGPVHPSPVPAGGSGTFEARLAPDDLVARYTAVVRPVGMITGSITELTAEIKDREQFAPIVMKRLRLSTQILVGPPRVIIEVHNTSAAGVTAVIALVDVETRCFLPRPRPGRFVVESGSHTIRVPAVPAGGTARATFAPTPTLEGCENFVILTARGRVAGLRVAD